MERYEEQIRELRLFTVRDLEPIAGGEDAAKRTLSYFRKKKLICSVYYDLHAFIDPETKTHTINKFEIGSNLTPGAYIGYHSALEYYGVTYKKLNELYVVSKNRFVEAEHDGIKYRRVYPQTNAKIYSPTLDSLVWITDLERAVVDCFDILDCAGGLEELIRCLCFITYLDENKLRQYIDEYNKPILYRKLGCILSFFRKTVQVSDDFIAYCKTKVGDGVYKESPSSVPRVHFQDWKVYISKVMFIYLELENSERIRLMDVVHDWSNVADRAVKRKT